MYLTYLPENITMISKTKDNKRNTNNSELFPNDRFDVYVCKLCNTEYLNLIDAKECVCNKRFN